MLSMLRGSGSVEIERITLPVESSTTATRDSVSAVTSATGLPPPNASGVNRKASGSVTAPARNSRRFMRANTCSAGGEVQACEDSVDLVREGPFDVDELVRDRARALEQSSVLAQMRKVKIRQTRLACA